MLRSLLVAATVVAIAAGGLLALTGARGLGAYLMLSGAIVLLGTVFERWRYRTSQRVDDAHWEHTGERFEDPTTHEILEVYFNPRTGERRYVAPR